jgi:hypothetical protein
MEVKDFYDIPSVKRIECSGKASLTDDADLFSLSLFTESNNKLLAYVNVGKQECSTSDHYSACVLDHEKNVNTKIVTLVTDLRHPASRVYGCNASSFRSGHVTLQSWRLLVKGYGEYYKKNVRVLLMLLECCVVWWNLCRVHVCQVKSRIFYSNNMEKSFVTGW